MVDTERHLMFITNPNYCTPPDLDMSFSVIVVPCWGLAHAASRKRTQLNLRQLQLYSDAKASSTSHQPMYSMLEYIRTDSAAWSYLLALLYSIAVSWIEFWPPRAQGWHTTARLAISSFKCNIWCYAVSSQSIEARAAVNMATSQARQLKRVLSLGKQ